MKYITKLKLATIHQLCDVEDRSTEYMIQYMQDTCNVNHDTVISYLTLSEQELNQLRKDVNNYAEFMVKHFNQ